jgi:hypothetical protein
MVDAKKCDSCGTFFDIDATVKNFITVLYKDTPMDLCGKCKHKVAAIVNGEDIPKKHRKPWSEESKEKARQRMLKNKIWEKSPANIDAPERGQGRKRLTDEDREKLKEPYKQDDEYMKKVKDEIPEDKRATMYCIYCQGKITSKEEIENEMCNECYGNIGKK